MKFKLITQVSELTEFSEKLFSYTGVQFLMEYWQHCRVVAAYNAQNKMIGGYALALEPPFRSSWPLSKIPEIYNKFIEKVSPEQMVEVSALWLDAEARSVRNKVELHRTMLNDICESEKPYFIYVYNLNKPYLQKLYSRLNPKVIFRGMLPGAMPNHYPVGIEYVLTAEIKEKMDNSHYRWEQRSKVKG